MGRRRKFNSQFKAKVALAAIQGDKTMSELSSEYGVHGNLINRWKQDALNLLPDIFVNPHDDEKDELIEELYKRIGQISVENEWLKKKLSL